jgi:N-acetylglutamate synthase-like GNAT family acetyltransferase
MIIIRQPVTNQDFKAYYRLRYNLLREPLGLPRGTEKDDYEAISLHFMAVDDQTGEVVGVVKLFESNPGVGRFSFLAVDNRYQRQGVGQKLLNTVEEKAREMKMEKLGTLARPAVVEYYGRYGYKPKGKMEVKYGKLQLIYLEKDLSNQ